MSLKILLHPYTIKYYQKPALKKHALSKNRLKNATYFTQKLLTKRAHEQIGNYFPSIGDYRQVYLQILCFSKPYTQTT